MALSTLPARRLPVPHGRAEQPRDPRHLTLPYWLSGALAILLVVASAAGLFIPGLYRDAPAWIAQTRGTDLVTLIVAAPALMAALSGLWLWPRRTWGYVLAGVLLTTLTLVGGSAVSGMVFAYRADPAVSLGAAPLLTVVTLVGLWLAVVYVRHLRPRQVHGPAALTAQHDGPVHSKEAHA